MEGQKFHEKVVDEEEIELGGDLIEQNQPIDGKWRDLPFAIAYYISLLVSVILGIYLLTKLNSDDDDNNDDAVLSFTFNFLQIFLGVLTAIIFTGIWLAVVIKFAECIIKSSLILSPVILFIVAIISFTSSVVLGIVLLLSAGFAAWYAYAVWNRVEFAAACLKIVIKVFKSFYSPLFINLSMAAVSIVLLVIDMTVFVGVANAVKSSGLQLLVMFFILFLIYWHNIVSIDVAHVTACGVMGTWFHSDATVDVTKNSFKRAITTSFGSICFGALIEAVIRALSALVRYLQNRNRDNAVVCVLLCILRCILDCIGDIVEYINSYAFVYVALYGKPYIESAKDLWSMFRSRGIEALINDDLTGIPFMVGGVINVMLVILVCMVAGDFSLNILIAVIFGLVIYFCCVYTLISYIKTLFVCWMSDPATFSEHRPNEFKEIVTAANKFGYNTQWCEQHDSKGTYNV